MKLTTQTSNCYVKVAKRYLIGGLPSGFYFTKVLSTVIFFQAKGGERMLRRTERRAAWLFLALVPLTVCLAPLTALAQQVVGTVAKLSGSAQIQRAGATIAVIQGMAVDLHDQLTTSVNSSATVRLASGITLTLAGHTSLTFNQNVTTGGTGRTQLNLLEGGLRSLGTAAAADRGLRNSHAQCDHCRARD